MHQRSFPSAFLASALLYLTSAPASHAAETLPWLDVGFLLFGDFYTIPSHHLESGDGATGVVLRRGYLTGNLDWSNNWFGRVRLELNQSGEFEAYDFELDFKDIYVGRDFAEHRALFGLIPTLTFDVVESSWGKRHLLRTPLDLQGEPSRDTGASLKGPLNETGRFSYRVMLGSGAEFGAESGDGRKAMLALNLEITDRWMVDVYWDQEKLEGPTDRRTLQVFSEYNAQDWRLGALYANQDRQEDAPLEVASAWWIRRLAPNTDLITRIDRLFEPSPRGNNISYIPFDPSATATMFYAGVEFFLGDHVSVTPNLVVTAYDRNDQGIRPETDVYLRLTAFVNFE